MIASPCSVPTLHERAIVLDWRETHEQRTESQAARPGAQALGPVHVAERERGGVGGGEGAGVTGRAQTVDGRGPRDRLQARRVLPRPDRAHGLAPVAAWTWHVVREDVLREVLLLVQEGVVVDARERLHPLR